MLKQQHFLQTDKRILNEFYQQKLKINEIKIRPVAGGEAGGNRDPGNFQI